MTRPRVPHFGLTNWADTATLTALNAGPAELGVGCLQVEHPAEYHEQAGAELALRVDLGAERPVDLLMLVITNAGTGATLDVRANGAADMSGADLYRAVGSARIDPAIGYAWHLTPETVTARYWELRLADPALTATRAGLLVMTPLVAWSRPRKFGFKPGWVDPSDTQRGDGGQFYAAAKPGWRKFSFGVATRDEAEAFDLALEIERVVGKRAPMAVLVDPGAANPSQHLLWGVKTEQAGLDEPGLRVWSYSFTFEERRQ